MMIYGREREIEANSENNAYLQRNFSNSSPWMSIVFVRKKVDVVFSPETSFRSPISSKLFAGTVGKSACRWRRMID